MVSKSDKVKGTMMGGMKGASQALHGRTAIYSTLAKEHGKVDALLSELVSTADSETGRRQDLFSKIRSELLEHTKKEDEIFYKKLEEHPETAERITHFREQHAEVEQLLGEMKETPFDDSAFLEKAKTLKTKVEEHVQEEEKGLFPDAEDVLTKADARSLDAQYTTKHVDV